MIWARMLAYITGTVDQELLLRNEYLAAENRILRAQIKGRLLLSDAEKATLAEIAHRLRRKALEELDRKSTRLNSSHGYISYAVFCLKKKKTIILPADHTNLDFYIH